MKYSLNPFYPFTNHARREGLCDGSVILNTGQMTCAEAKRPKADSFSLEGTRPVVAPEKWGKKVRHLTIPGKVLQKAR